MDIDNHAVLIAAAVAMVAIVGLCMSSQQLPIQASDDASGAAVARPMVGDECNHIQCAPGQQPAKIKSYDGYTYCACGDYQRGPPPETVFEYDLADGQWVPN